VQAAISTSIKDPLSRCSGVTPPPETGMVRNRNRESNPTESDVAACTLCQVTGNDQKKAGTLISGFSVLLDAQSDNLRGTKNELTVSRTMSAPPAHLRVLKDAGLLELEWADGTTSRLPLILLRSRCPCASCVDEFTGERILDPATIPETIVPVKMEFSGNYALKITWSDGHSTGLYTWDLLAEIARCTKSN
jgi:DUF971 family protein